MASDGSTVKGSHVVIVCPVDIKLRIVLQQQLDLCNITSKCNTIQSPFHSSVSHHFKEEIRKKSKGGAKKKSKKVKQERKEREKRKKENKNKKKQG